MTSLYPLSLDILYTSRKFRQRAVDFDAKMLPCRHYATAKLPTVT